MKPKIEKGLRAAIKQAMKDTDSDNPDVLAHHISREPFYSEYVACDEEFEHLIIRLGLKILVVDAIDNNSLEYDDFSELPPFSDDGCLGLCPKCRRNDGMLNVGPKHWVVCHTHKVRWCRGTNLFSCWRDETEEDWEKNNKLLSTYEMVMPFCNPPKIKPPWAIIDDYLPF